MNIISWPQAKICVKNLVNNWYYCPFSCFIFLKLWFISPWGYPLITKYLATFCDVLYHKNFFVNIRIFHAMNFADKMPSPHRLLIVGAGLTGSVTASLLRRKFPKDVLSITVWEKSRGAGGRMTTNRSPSDPRCTADLGAQYISATSAYAKSHERQVAILIKCYRPR